MTLRIVLVEDHTSLRQALAAVIGMQEDLVVAAEIAEADDPLVDALPPADVVVVDLDLPGGDGIDVIARVRARVNEPTGQPPACVVLTGLTDDRELGRAIEAGASAVLHKSTPMPEVLDVIRRVGHGETVLSAADTSRRLQALAKDREQRWEGRLLAERLTPRELEILQLLVHGLGNEAIAAELVLSPATVQTHVRNLMGRLDAGSRLEAVALGLRLGLVDPPPGPDGR
ncbi:LuxR C-terminal-related transcriptional regulator [Euzebya rosea]|uniref:LuxR C-terminal-related transcriptional regulator n=1 Tax=Euzebya rosea TaxID=2052804 RepID=UPI00147640FB|nr:response regulator transcription factor [Euzebya rosea]